MIEYTARGLVKVMQKFDRFDGIVSCIKHPRFTATMDQIERAAPGVTERLIISEKSMFDVAYVLAKNGIKSGILNPSDQEALLSGNLGQFWYNGHIAVEELFVHYTTILLNNFAVTKMNPPNYSSSVKMFDVFLKLD